MSADGGMLQQGEQVLFIDSKRRRYLVRLGEGRKFETHAGVVEHDEVIGGPEGRELRSNSGARFIVFRPTLTDLVLKMPRGAQVIYPKDLGPILLLADVRPGVRILESGLGSGALSSALLRVGAVIHGYEIREDFAERAVANVILAAGEEALERYHVEVRDVYEGTDQTGLDRVVLDLPEPWQVVPHLVGGALRPGGILCAYTPSITQAAQLRATMAEFGFEMAETVEILNRTWHIEGPSLRPDHRMVGHTGFLTHGRATRTTG
jgi:tRNA (adenine57-N1/adenine58-N1)-methyltransferase catalytic subunit